MDRRTHPLLVADDAAGNRHETAVLLVGTAREYGISQRDIRAVRGGFRITQRLADVLYDDDVEQEQDTPTEEPVKKTAPKKAAEKKAPAKKTAPKKAAAKSSSTTASGNRAAKNTGTDKE